MDRWFNARKRAYQVRRDIEAKHGKVLYGKALLKAIIDNEEIVLDEVAANDPLLGGGDDKYCQATYDPRFGGTITVNRDASPEKYVLYVGHELGHHFLHTRKDICNDNDADPERIVLTVPYAEGKIATYNPYQIQENEANIFAIELLIPSQQIAKKFDAGVQIEDLQSFYGVSRYGIFAQLMNSVLGPSIDFEAQQKIEQPFHWTDLDPSQTKAACIPVGPTLVDAGPGTGKTRTLISRIAWLVDNGVAPESIIALTFSNKATDEVRSRLQKVMPAYSHQVTVSTFHAFGIELLRRYGYLIGIQQDFTVLDPVDAETLLTEHLDQLRLNHFADPINPGRFLSKSVFGGSILDFISRLKQDLITTDVFTDFVNSLTTDKDADVEKFGEIAYIYNVYEQLKRDRNVVDFDDLLVIPYMILQANEDKIEELRSLYRYVLVDEFQDINRANGELVGILAGTGEGLWVVGDVRQSIYRWRGASPTYLKNFRKQYPNAIVKHLEMNYRSTSTIVNYLNTITPALGLIDASVQWQSNGSTTSESGIYQVTAGHKIDECSGVVSTIEQLLNQSDYEYRDIAILCRTRRIATDFANVLQDADIPVLHFGDFFERTEIKDLLAVVDFVVNSHGVSWVRVAQTLDNPLSRTEAITLWQYIDKQKGSLLSALSDVSHFKLPNTSQHKEIEHLAQILSDYQYDSLANPWLIMAEFLFTYGSYLRRLRGDLERNLPSLLALRHLLRLARSYSLRDPIANQSSRAKSFLHYVRALVNREDDDINIATIGSEINAVTILTIHKAKGLEFPIVFVPNIDKVTFTSNDRSPGNIPQIPAGLLQDIEENAKDLEEKSCLFVAISRAKEHLYLSYASKQDSGKNRNPSDYWQLLQSPDVIHERWFELGGISTIDNFQEEVPPETIDKLSVSGMRVIEYCPRQYYYHYVLRLDVTQVSNEIYLNFHNTLTHVIKWLHSRVQNGETPIWVEVESEFKKTFYNTMPENHAHTSWYLTNGLRQIEFIYKDILSRVSEGEIQYQVEYSGELSGIPFTIVIDELLETENETIAFHYRIGKKKSGNLRMYLYRQVIAAKAFTGLSLRTHSSFDEMREVSTESAERTVARQLSMNIELINRQEFPPLPKGKWVCSSCPFLFICPH